MFNYKVGFQIRYAIELARLKMKGVRSDQASKACVEIFSC